MSENVRNSSRALLYGKRESVLHQDHVKPILNELRNQGYEIHATLWTKHTKDASPEDLKDYISSVPDFIINHGYVNQSSFLQLLRASKAMMNKIKNILKLHIICKFLTYLVKIIRFLQYFFSSFKKFISD